MNRNLQYISFCFLGGLTCFSPTTLQASESPPNSLFDYPKNALNLVAFSDYRMIFHRQFEDVIPDSVIFLINAINASLPKLEESNGASLLALATACVDNVLRIIEAN